MSVTFDPGHYETTRAHWGSSQQSWERVRGPGRHAGLE
jgi:hypothetical protein